MKDAGRAGTEGREEEEPVFVDAKVVLEAVGAGEEVLGAAGIDVEAAAAAAMVPLRSHGFGGEPIGRTLRVQRKARVWVNTFIQLNPASTNQRRSHGNYSPSWTCQ